MSSESLRIALAVAEFAPSTDVRAARLDRLARELAATGHHVTVLTHDRRPGVPDYELGPGVVVHRFPGVFSGGRATLAGSMARHLSRATDDYDLVHAHDADRASSVLAAASWAGPLVLTPGGDLDTRPRRGVLARPRRSLRAWVVRRADRIVCTSGSEAERLIRVHPEMIERADVIAVGVDVDRLRSAPMSPESDGRRILLAPGPLTEATRTDQVVTAMTRLRDDFVLKVLGDGPQRARLGALVRRCGLDRDVHLLGDVPDETRASLLRTASCLVSLAPGESDGVIVAEALAARARVLVSATPAHVDLERRAEGALSLVSVDAHPHTIADSVRSVCRQPRPDVFVPSWAEVALQTSLLYRRVIDSTAGGAARRPPARRRTGVGRTVRRVVG